MAIVDELVALLGYDIQGEGDLRKFNKSLDDLEKKAYAVGMAMGRMAAIAGTAVVAGMAFLGKSVLDTSAKFESYAATLETIEGSAAGAEKALDWIANFAKTTPYEVDELTAAFVKLRSYGLDPMDGTMVTIGDTASAMGKSLNQAVEAWADATTGEFERLKEFGIRAKQQGDQVTFFWTQNGQEQSRVVKKTSTDIQKFLNDVMGRKFAGAMVRQSKTWNGMMSNLGDSWTDLQRRIGDAGFFDAVKNKLGDVMDVINNWATDGTIDKIASTLSGMFTKAADVIGWVVERIVTHVTFLSENFQKFKPYIEAVGWALLALAAWAFPVVAAFIALGLAVDDFLTWLEGGDSVIGDFIEWCGQLPQILSEAANAFSSWLGNVDWVAMGAAAGGALVDAIVMAIVGYTQGTQAIARWVVDALSAVDWGAVWNAWNAGWTALFELMAGVLIGFGARIAEVIKGWFNIDLSGAGAALGQSVVDGIVNSIKAGAAAVGMAVMSIIPGGAQLEQFRQNGGIPGMMNSQGGAQAGALIGSGVIKPTDVTNNNTTTVNAPVTINAQTNASPASIGTAVGNAIGGAVQKPARMQGGPAQ